MIYFHSLRPVNSHLLIRGTHNRRVNDDAKYLHSAIQQIQPCGTLTVELQRNPERQPRTATLTLRFAQFEFQVRAHHKQRSQQQPIQLQVILAAEENPPSDQTAIRWLLLTTVNLNGFDDVVRCVRWYTYRWLIERYHYTLIHWLWHRKNTTRNGTSNTDGISYLFNCSMALAVADVSSTSQSRLAL